MEMSQTLPGLIEIVWLDLILSATMPCFWPWRRARCRRAAAHGRDAGTLSFILARVGIAFALLTCAGLPESDFSARRC